MGWFRNTLAAAAIGAAVAAPGTAAAEVPSSAATPATLATPQPASTTTTPAPVVQGPTLEAPPTISKAPRHSAGGGGTSAATKTKKAPKGTRAATTKPAPGATTAPPSAGIPTLSITNIPSSTCAAAGVPPQLIPIYERAAGAYNLGPQGPAVLAGINEVETAFGTNLNVSSAGAVGWMQFMPSTWAIYGVDANGDGVKNPYNPEDAIFAAARYLSAAGMPSDTYAAILAYNHADWYVAEVLANASCYAPDFGGSAATGSSVPPQLPVMSCRPAPAWRREVPREYLSAFEDASARYGLGRRGVWALAAVAHLESNFGRGMDRHEMQTAGPLGLEPSEWRQYAVDGDGDGRIRHADPADSAATLARLIWAHGSLRAGLFAHNQAEWYVQAVLAEADRMQGRCKVTYTDWSIALPAAAGGYVDPFSLSSNLVTGRVDQGVDFTGTGPIEAIGEAKILATGAPGWPEGGGVLYQLLGGPLKGQQVYVYEGVDATVRAGQTVKAGQQIANFRPGGSIETGFADPAGVPLSHGEYYEGKVTRYGLQMLSLLQDIGV